MAGEKSKLKGLKILLGVSGGIAAYKAVDLASKLTAAGSIVKTVMTDSACELIGPKSFEALTGNPVFMNLWNSPDEYEIGHIDLASWADIVLVVPATANIIGKIANGICDDLLSTTMCACWRKPVIIAPAMNNRMWEHPAVQKNISIIKDMGFELVGPVKGRLACGDEAVGRMAEPANIISVVEKAAARITNK